MNDITYLPNPVTIWKKMINRFAINKLEKMNKKILTPAFIGLIALTVLNVFGQTEKATAKVTSAQNNLKEAKIDSAEDYQKFINDAQMNIMENKKLIASLKLKKTSDSEKANKKYNKKVLALEKTNNNLEKEINGSEHTKTDSWARFKLNFNRNREKLGQDIKNI